MFIKKFAEKHVLFGSNDEKICNHWDSPNFNFSTEKKEMVGLGIGVASMKSGERALFHVGWELGYGEEGCFSFPNVPPAADLVYEVELIGFDDVKEVGSPLFI